MYQDIVEVKEVADVAGVNQHLDRGWHFLQAVAGKNAPVYLVGRTAAARVQDQASGLVEAGAVPVSVVETLPKKVQRVSRPRVVR
jgi:hypothetical protein